MKIIYSVLSTQKCDSFSLADFDNENDAREFFGNELKKCGKPADISGWRYHDKAWSDVYFIELVKLTIDDEDDDYLVDSETLSKSDYYWI